MGYQAAADHLSLWRGIDDVVWREALRSTRPRRATAPLPDLWREDRRTPERAPEPALPLVSEPA